MEEWTREGFERFHAENAGPLWRYLRGLTGSPAEADDGVQESFLRLLEQGDPARGEKRLRAYLYRIATNRVRDGWRRARRSPFVTPSSSDDDDSLPEVPVPPRDDARRLDFWPVFGELSARDRSLLWLGHVESWPHREIADALGLRAASVRVLLFRARRRLETLLDAAGLAPEPSSGDRP